MKWTLCGNPDFSAFVDFALQKEWEHTFITSRLIAGSGFRLPPKNRFPIFLLKDKSSLRAACMVTPWGGLFPLFKSIDPPDDKDLKSLVTRLKYSLKRIYSIMGTEERTDLLRPHLNESKEFSVNYNLMIRKEKSFVPPLPEKGIYSILKAGPDDAASLLGLEIDYQKEEVFIDPTQIDSSRIYHNLRSSLNEQIIYYVSNGILPVAKAGTNAIGYKWNQIGGVFTDKSFRGCGISTWLMHYLLDILEKEGKKTVLFVKDNNQAAEKVYNKLGFEKAKKFNITYYI